MLADDWPFDPRTDRAYEIQPILTIWVATDSYTGNGQEGQYLRRSKSGAADDGNPLGLRSRESVDETPGESGSSGARCEQHVWLAVAGATVAAALALV